MLFVRALMLLFVMMVEREKQPKRRWWQRRRPITSLLTFAESGVDSLPIPVRPKASGPTKTQPSTESSHVPVLEWSPATPSEPQHRATVEVVPTSLVDHEAQTAIRLQMPIVGVVPSLRTYGHRRFDTPIGRTLTREFLVRDPGHTPSAAIRHLPIMDGVRAMAVHGNVGSQPTSPAGAKKGRATPKRPRRGHGTR